MAQATKQNVKRLFTKPKTKAYDSLKWVKRDSAITNPMTGKAVFEQKDVEFPETWSLNAINIVAQKYFTGTPGTDSRETSLKHLIDRVADTITRQGVQEGYFVSEAEAEDFRAAKDGNARDLRTGGTLLAESLRDHGEGNAGLVRARDRNAAVAQGAEEGGQDNAL